ncbi:MAG: hypothetical protein P1P82_00750 [Bacteroidales bacterium]|nr:hypothetical protein [Bacteroidales bacterium]MDT8430084.1 hypothetical protein [Bacteroidales bacterium]
MVYEDENCEVIYDLWGEKGNIGFTFYNKTDETIFLNMEESFFLQNGIAYDYFKNRVFTVSEGTGVSVSGSSFNSKFMTANQVANAISSEESVSFTEKQIVRIPSNSAKIIAEYNINEALIRDCDLLKYPKKEKDIITLEFEKSGSPIVFSNRLLYYVGTPMNPITVENEFYISEITNYPKDMLVKSTYEEYCGQKSSLVTYKMKYFSPYHFYIIYNKGTDFWEH